MRAARVRAYAARHRGVTGFAAGVMAATTIGGGVALAAIPSSANGSFTACVSNRTGAVRMIDYQAGRRCTSSERTVSWSKGYRYRSGWMSLSTYAPLDVVTYNGSSYVAKIPSRSKVPTNTTFWGLLAARGATGATGATGAAGAAATKLWAEVDTAGTLIASSAGVTSTRSGTGNYYVTFPSDVSHCASVASAGQTPIFGTAGSGTGRAVGILLVDQLSAGGTFTGGHPTGTTVQVESLNLSGAAVDNGFKLAVFC